MSTPDLSLWKMNHTMIRVKDPARSITFYKLLGMTQIDKLPVEVMGFDLHFVTFDKHDSDNAPSAGKPRSDRQGVLELSHSYGTEKDDSFGVSNGNQEPHLGFEHLGVTVRDLDQVVRQLQSHGISVSVTEGSQNSEKATTAIVQDPDGYFVELRQGGSNVLNSTGLRIKDPEISLPWYADTLGMQLFHTARGDDRTMYWLGYTDGDTDRGVFDREGLVKLICIHGSEKEEKEGRLYHNGNTEPEGFGHLGKNSSQCVVHPRARMPTGDEGRGVCLHIHQNVALATDDIAVACAYLENKDVEFSKKLTDGIVKSIAFFLDPDGYWIEVIQNARIKEPLGIQ